MTAIMLEWRKAQETHEFWPTAKVIQEQWMAFRDGNYVAMAEAPGTTQVWPSANGEQEAGLGFRCGNEG